MSFHYHGFCPIRFWESAQLLGHSWPTFDTMIQCLRLATQPEVIPHSNPTYTRYLGSFICCGWGYGPIITPLPRLLSDQILVIAQYLGCSWPTVDTIIQCLRLATHNQNSSHNQIKYIQGVWEASYAVDGHMNPSSLLLSDQVLGVSSIHGSQLAYI
jgi:hypothetical protein